MARFDPVAYRASRAKEYGVAPTPAAAPETAPISGASVFKPFQEAGVLTTNKDKSFVRKIGEDALTLGLVPSALVAEVPHAIQHPIEFAKSTGMGFADSVVNMFDPEEWKAHPLLNAVNTALNVSVVGGLLKASALSTVRTSTINAAKIAAVESGANQLAVEAAFKATKPLKAAFYEAAKTKTTAPVISTTKTYLMRAGVAEDVATNIASKVASETFGKYMTENATKLATFEAMAHPIQAFGKASQVTKPIQELIFGQPEKSAVGKLYGSEEVKKNVRGYGQLEEWAGMQTAEKGLKNTVDNRVRVMQDWVAENPEFAALTPAERIAHFQEYAKADLARFNLAKVKGREYVLTKALPEHYTEAMVEFVNTLPKNLSNAEVIESLTGQFGKDFSLHVEEVRARLAGQLEGKERGLLTDAVKGLANKSLPVTVSRLSKGEQALLKDLENSGYRIGRAPTKKLVSQPKGVTGDIYDKAALVSERTALGRLTDKLGLSPQGVVEGVQFFGFREAFTQAALKTFGKGKNILINGVKYPVESLSFKLEDLRRTYMTERGAAKNVILPPMHTIADLRYRDLIKFGFDEKTATALDAIIRESSVTSPSVTGIGESLMNYLRTRNGPLADAYNKFLRVQSTYRFRNNPMFGLQAFVEANVWGNMWAKQLPGGERMARAVGRITGLKTPIINASKEATMKEQSMVMENVMQDYNRQLRDAGMQPEIYRGKTPTNFVEEKGIAGVKQKIAFEAQNLDANIWTGVFGFSNVKLTTNLMRAYGRRFGMELDEALAFTMKDGKKVYDHPWLVDNMRSAAQGIFGYKSGVLTSPLIRTLNVAFFPIRFQTKTMIQTAQWLGSLSPMSRLVVMNQMMNMADFLTTPEGEAWRKKNRPVLASMFNYVFAFEGMGKSVNAATKGQLFGGNTGLIGGLPFGFLSNIAADLGYIKQDEQRNVTTGKPFQREVIRNSASFAGFVTAVEDVLTSLIPAMPFYTATGGQVTFSANREARTFIEQTLSALAGIVAPGVAKDFQKSLRKERMKVRPDFQKKFPNPINLVAPTAEAAELSIATRDQPKNFWDFNNGITVKKEKSPLSYLAGKPGVVQGVDISSYATDPGHEKKIARIVDSIPEMSDPVEIDEYIKRVAATSSVRGGMVKRAADQYGVSVRLLLAIMQNDSHFGTLGKGARTRNPGNYGNDDTGQLIHFKTWEDGVRAVAAWLSDHRSSQLAGAASTL